MTPNGVPANASSTRPNASDTAVEMSVEMTKLIEAPHNSIANVAAGLVDTAAPKRPGSDATSDQNMRHPRDHA